MRPAFPASDYYEGSATRPALAEGWPTPLPESRTCFPSSTRLHLHAVLGPACTPGTARCRARHRRMPIKGSTASLPEQGCLCKEETEIPMTPPSPYRERVVHGATLQSAVPFVTITALWLAARGVVGWPPPHCREGFRHDSASGPRACFPSHRPTPGRVPHLEHSTYALLGAPPFAMWSAFPTSDYYEGSATRPTLAEGWPTPLPESRTSIEWGRRRRWPGGPGWSAPSPSPNRTCDFHRIRLSIRWVRPMWVGNIGFSAIIVGFIHPSSGVVRFVPHPSDCPPSPCGRLSRPRTTTRALPHVRRWPKAGLLRCRRAGRASQVRPGCVFMPS